MKAISAVWCALSVLMLPSLLRAVDVSPEEMTSAEQWAAASFNSPSPKLPFSFTYDGKPSGELLKHWELKRESKQLDAQRTENTLIFRDPQTRLEVRCVEVEYKDFPTVEWTLHFRNAGLANTPILENIQAIDLPLERGPTGEFVLHYGKGSTAEATDYEPLESELRPLVDERIATSGGRGSNTNLPYFNIEWPGQGVIVVIGWPGQWAAKFTRVRERGLRVQAGQELTHFKLFPGEEVRSPLAVVQFWKGDWLRSQNIWRRWMLAHNLPRNKGQPLAPFLAGASCPYFGFVHNDEQNQEQFIDGYHRANIKLDYWWIDAGWYPNNGSWTSTGTWEVDPQRFPGGLRAVSDHAHAQGVKLIIWFEPERVMPGTWLFEKHPEWLLAAPPNPGDQSYSKDTRLLNLGNSEAWTWLTNHIDKFITDQGIDLYRQDFNMDPLNFWRANDAPDRQGITENKHVTGYLAYWDELRRRHGDILIDTCASGGRRNDLETLRRSVPLWRSDARLEPVGMQNHTYGISLWIPFSGLASNLVETNTSPKQIDAYAFRSEMYPAIHSHWDVRGADLEYDRLRELVRQWREIGPDYLGDFYPLTSYSSANDVWMAWQFDRPDTGQGMVQVFRRPESPFETAHLKLQGLDLNAHYTVTNMDDPGGTDVTGRELMERGVSIALRDRPDSALFVYKKTR
jgi:alpha-galactosidase